jgi:hypothetical protein
MFVLIQFAPPLLNYNRFLKYFAIMEKYILHFVLAFSCVITSGNAQVYRGRFGSAFGTSVYNLSPSLQNELQDKNAVGNNLQLNTVAYSYGGSGYTLKPKGFILGGAGGTYKITSNGNNGNATLNVSSGVFNIGYLVLNKRKWMGFPYFGLGAFGSNFKVSNSTSEKNLIIGKDSILSGKQAKYSAGGFAFDLGFALKYFAFDKINKMNKNVKGMIGIDAGLSFFPAFTKWQNVSSHVYLSSVNTPFIMNGYLRLTIGLGVFYDQDKLKEKNQAK